jgi:membrane fusion protein, copper/silver efflux system
MTGAIMADEPTVDRHLLLAVDRQKEDRQKEDRQKEEPMAEGDEPPPRGVATMAIVRWVILGVAVVLAAFMWFSYGQAELGSRRTGSTTTAPKYLCPMHPQIVSSEPGECPICHMNLEPMSAERASGRALTDAAAGGHAVPASADTTYTCPMHPEARSATPGRCPICKMPLEELASDAGTIQAGMRATQPGAVPLGTVPIQLAFDRVQSIGVRTALVEERETSGALRVTAIISPAEQGAAEVHVRTPGFVEAILVDQTGVGVGAGQPLLSLYSPELLQAQNELLATRKWASDAGLSDAARRKLDLLGMAPKEIDRVIEKGEPLKAISIAAPRAGYVTKKNVVLGSYVTPDMTLYEIQDLSRVYVVAEVFLRDMPHVSVGTEARFVPAGDSSRSATAKVDLVYPLINAEARTRRVRMQIKSEAGKRHVPGEYGVVELSTGKRKALTIPRDALVDTGTAQYVFIVEKEGRFVPRTVTVGTSEGNQVIIDAGLQPGERVVSGSTFLIDSESRLQASVSQAARGAPAASRQP